jgi:HD-like signal output (HDOD) protein
VRQAAMMLGKKHLYAIIINGLSQDLTNDLDLSMYNINYDEMMAINKLRSLLITEWARLMKMSQSDIESINTLSLLLVLGTNLAAQALNYNLQGEKFKSMIETDDIDVVEKRLLNYNSYEITTKLFEAWNFPQSFIKTSRNIPLKGAKKKFMYDTNYRNAFMISTIHRIFRLDGKFKIDKKILEEVKETGLDSNTLHLAFKNNFGDKYKGHLHDLLYAN